ALDHVAFQLVRINRPKSDYSEFPICKTRCHWRETRPGKLPDVPARALAEVQRLQPYKRGDRARLDPLWLVHALDIIDKHRRLNLVSPIVREVDFLTTDCVVVDEEFLAGAFETGTPILRYRVEAHGPNVRVETVFAFDITFGEGELLAGEPLIRR